MTAGARPVGAAIVFTAAATIILAGPAGRAKAVRGDSAVDPVTVAEHTFPYQHLSMTPQGAGVLVTLDDGTGYPTRTFISVPADGRAVVCLPLRLAGTTVCANPSW